MTNQGYLEDIVRQFEILKSLGAKALGQLRDDDYFRQLNDQSNSIAIIIKHLAGNMRSRWTDFLTSDGEKPDRHRDTEFESEGTETADSIRRAWAGGWDITLTTLRALEPDELSRTITIRSQPHSVYGAIHRQMTHYASHIGQIVYLARYYCGDNWRSLSIPRGQSEAFNKRMGHDPAR